MENNRGGHSRTSVNSSKTIALGLLTGFLLTATSSVAIADDWVAEKLRGSVLAFEAGEWVPLHRGDIVSDDRYVKTLGDG